MNSPPKLPKVSVIICVYNNSQYIKDAIDSAIAQDYPNLDIWVIDDGSTEDIYSIVNKYEHMTINSSTLQRSDEIQNFYGYIHNNKHVFYIRLKKNSGPSTARNIGIVNAIVNGSHLFQILDADDQMYPNKVSSLIHPIMLDPERIAITYGDYIIQNETGICRYESKFPYDFNLFFSGNCIIHSGCLINGLALQQLGNKWYPEDQRVCEDYYLARCILRSGQWIAFHIPKILTLVRSHSEDSTNSVKKEIWERDYRKTMMNS